MFKKIEIGILLIMAIIDAYLIGHPNLLGKLGLWFYKYEMINSFPKAMLTVGFSMVFSYLMAHFLKKQNGKNWAKWTLLILLLISGGILLTVFFKFNSVTYSHTGKSFIYGMHLLPILLIYIFGTGLFGWFGSNK